MSRRRRRRENKNEIFGGQIVYIKEGKGQLVLFFTLQAMFYLPLSFSFFIFLLLHNFIIFLPQIIYTRDRINPFFGGESL